MNNNKIEEISFPIAEKFISLSGESLFAGRRSAFIRFSGCNLNCRYCDTLWAIDPSSAVEQLDISEIVLWVKQSAVQHLVLTGGEPLLQQGIVTLIDSLLTLSGLTVEIETNGSQPLSPLSELMKQAGDLLLITMDWKLPGSGMQQNMLPENLELLRKTDVLKFVVSDSNDLTKAAELILKYQLDERMTLFFSPVTGEISLREIAEFMLKQKYSNARVQVQLHKVIWDPTTRGV